MRWSDAVRAVLPGPSADAVVEHVSRRWGGARLYLPLSATRLEAGRMSAAANGAAEQFARDVLTAVLDADGTLADARAILLPLAGRHIHL